MKRDIWKRKKSSNKSSDRNTRFDDTYPLYKYNICIDYHHIMKEIITDIQKRRKPNNKVVNVIMDFEWHLPTIQVQYRHRFYYNNKNKVI